MKLIIDVPENIYEALRKADVIISGQRSGKSLTSIIFDAVAKGIPIKDEVIIATLLSLATDKDYKPELEGSEE